MQSLLALARCRTGLPGGPGRLAAAVRDGARHGDFTVVGSEKTALAGRKTSDAGGAAGTAGGAAGAFPHVLQRGTPRTNPPKRRRLMGVCGGGGRRRPGSGALQMP
jgi:hypothetical protein